ncbi:MAG TPA: hypothetical protein VJN18_30405 [Polyangiaceae bacterium]|nr:hypothetical protein [Polyangiaceae bacterium]
MGARRIGAHSFRLAFCVAASPVLALLGCGSPTLGDAETSAVSITLTTTASDPSVATVGEPAGGLVVSRVFVSASSLTLLPCRSDAAEIALLPRGYDLLASPAPNEYINTAVRELCGLRLDIDPLAQNVTDGVPEGTSIYVQGTDAAATPFELASEQSLSLLLEAQADSSFGDQPLILAFDLSTWLAAIPLTEDMAEKAIEMLEAQARASAAVYMDSDESGTLDGAEQTAVALPAPAR